MNFKNLYTFILLCLFLGCGNDESIDTTFTCKDLSHEQNATFIVTSLSPIVKGKKYMIAKDSGSIKPLNDGDVISLNISAFDVNGDNKTECVMFWQDLNDTNPAKFDINP